MLKKWDVTIPALTGDAPLKAYIYLPEYYDEDPNRRFPVMYMLDGQNIFLDEDASFGKSWGMYDFMKWTRKPDHRGGGVQPLRRAFQRIHPRVLREPGTRLYQEQGPAVHELAHP